MFRSYVFHVSMGDPPPRREVYRIKIKRRRRGTLERRVERDFSVSETSDFSDTEVKPRQHRSDASNTSTLGEGEVHTVYICIYINMNIYIYIWHYIVYFKLYYILWDMFPYQPENWVRLQWVNQNIWGWTKENRIQQNRESWWNMMEQKDFKLGWFMDGWWSHDPSRIWESGPKPIFFWTQEKHAPIESRKMSRDVLCVGGANPRIRDEPRW